MRKLVVLLIIAMLFVMGDALKCVKGSYMGYPSVDDKILLTEICNGKENACGLAILNWSNGAVSTERSCADVLHPGDIKRSVESNNVTIQSFVVFFCHTDLCNLAPPPSSHNHAQSISPNFIFFFVSCTLAFIITNLRPYL